jgi:hypothetical protein
MLKRRAKGKTPVSDKVTGGKLKIDELAVFLKEY